METRSDLIGFDSVRPNYQNKRCTMTTMIMMMMMVIEGEKKAKAPQAVPCINKPRPHPPVAVSPRVLPG